MLIDNELLAFCGMQLSWGIVGSKRISCFDRLFLWHSSMTDECPRVADLPSQNGEVA